MFLPAKHLAANETERDEIEDDVQLFPYYVPIRKGVFACSSPTFERQAVHFPHRPTAAAPKPAPPLRYFSYLAATGSQAYK